MVFVDQPFGTGFSNIDKSKIPNKIDPMIDDLLEFFIGFYQNHPHLQGKKLTIAGESYGGRFISLLAKKIADQQIVMEHKYGINLRKIFIMSGWLNPYNQYEGIYKFSVENNIIP